MSFRIISKAIFGNPGNSEGGGKLWRCAQTVGWQIYKRTGGKPYCRRLASGAKFMSHPDCVISSALIYADWPEYHELQFIRVNLEPDDFVLDVGANVGHVGLLLSDKIQPERIFAFEPTPLTFRRLQENWKLNDWGTDGLQQMAVGEKDGVIQIADVSHPDTMNSVLRTNHSSPAVAVPLRRLDSFRNGWNSPGQQIGLLKVDVEGFEAAVFRGAEETISQDRPRLILFESLSGAVNGEVMAVLDRAEYRVFQLSDAGLPDFTRQQAQNLFAAPVELLQTLKVPG